MVGPLYGNLDHAKDILSGASISISGAIGPVGGQWNANQSGVLAGPAWAGGANGGSFAGTYSWCWDNFFSGSGWF
jgi:hypothetical protein